MPALSEQPKAMLRWRQQMIRWVIRKCRTDWQADEGVEAVKEKHEGKLVAINAELRRRRREAREAAGEELPPAPVCQMKVATLGASCPNRATDIVETARRILAQSQEG